MRTGQRIGLAAGLLFLLGSVGFAQTAAKDKEKLDFFEKKIRPVLVQQCYECHSASSSKVKGGLLLDTRDGLLKGGESGAALVPGNAEESLLIEALKYEGLEMPPKQKLPDSVIADFEKWVQMGALDPRDGKATQVRKEINFDEAKKFWAFQSPKAAAAPAVKNAGWPKSDIDRFVLAAMESNGLRPVADADRRTLIRRVTFDLTGLPPTPAEIDAFLDDKSPTAFETVVDRLLASPQFGERWGRHWLDIARYAESTGKERNVPFPYAWRYRDYVIDALNADKPYDEFIREQVAGDLLPAASDAEKAEHIVATGFLALGPKGLNERNAEQYLMDLVDEQIDVTCRAVIATTVGCARCHDHKFDPIPTTDYYALAGIFRSTETLAGVKNGARGNNNSELCSLPATAATPAVAAVSDTVKTKQTTNAEAFQAKNVEEELKKAQAQFEQLKQQRKKKPQQAAQFKQRATELRDKIAELEAQLKQGNKKGDDSGDKPAASVSGALAMAVQEARRPADAKLLVRGEVKDPGAEVPRDFVTVLKYEGTPKIDPSHSGRLELAEWLTSKSNPLTARVMVNRIWYHLFGTGIVETVDNFGALGETPTHPELLDHLAIRFMERGWSVKQAIRGIVLSRTYQLSGQHSDANYAIDPQNRWLWRMSARRLEAEAIRDAVLAVAGKLDVTRPAGSPTMELASGEVGRGLNLRPIMAASNHRSVYLPVLRGIVPEMLTAFDMADPNLPIGQRDVTIVATQALYMMNSPFVLEQSEQLAKRLVEDKDLDDARRIDRAYELTLSRPATDSERNRALQYLHDYQQTLEKSDKSKASPQFDAWTTFCQTLLASAEFRYVY